MNKNLMFGAAFFLTACGDPAAESVAEEVEKQDSLETQVEPTTSSEPWSESQLISADALVELMKDDDIGSPIIYNLGPSGQIAECLDIGPAQDPENMAAFKTNLSALPKDAEIVIYCGCCPFADCPNIRPAFELLNTEGFVNHKLLNLPKNLKTDWIDKGYPMNP